MERALCLFPGSRILIGPCFSFPSLAWRFSAPWNNAGARTPDQLSQEDVDVTVVLKSLPSAVEFYKALGTILFRSFSWGSLFIYRPRIVHLLGRVCAGRCRPKIVEGYHSEIHQHAKLDSDITGTPRLTAYYVNECALH
jgi:hypothetical protein